MKVAVSWSGGKDSCFSLFQALKMGYNPVYIFNIAVRRGEIPRVHGLDPSIINAQAEALNIPLIQREATWDTYEHVFRGIVRKLKSKGIEGIVFGDIHIEEHRKWNERVCKELQVEPILPLWKKDIREIAKEFINAGFNAIVVCIREDKLSREILGRRFNLELLETLRKFNVDLMGEYGEYHTLVLDGPIFKMRIVILETNIIKIAPHYLVLNPTRWCLVEKNRQNP